MSTFEVRLCLCDTMTKDQNIVRSLGVVGGAFFGGFEKLREVQRRAIPQILSGKNVLVASATASGKTEAIVAPLIARTRQRVSPRPPAVRVLVVAPTRALVNDLSARIEPPLANAGISCGRQTGDHRDKASSPFALVTTPESVDSMLVRDTRLERGVVVDHLLAGVAAVFIDEAHLLDGTPRGDQLCWLLGRLRRLRRLRPSSVGELHLCAGSATISDPAGLSTRLLGSDAIIIQVPGTREIDVFGGRHPDPWFRLRPSMDVAAVRSRLEITPPADLNRSAAERIWQALSSEGDLTRKILVFVPSRQLSDELSTYFSGALSRRRQLAILAHHGSLSRSFRERAELEFSTSRDAVMVATTTLEVGIDIGDVDLVALVGAPPGTRSLLQRIGRAGRRIGCTRVLGLPRTEIERAALASMLISARDGILEKEEHARRWSVFVQQAASFVAQNRPAFRRRSDLLDLAREVCGEDSVGTASAIIDALVRDEYLAEVRGRRLDLSGPWADSFDDGRGMHTNFSTGIGIPVVNASTGDIVAHVSQRPDGNEGLALGGQSWDLQGASQDELLLSPRGAGAVKGSFRYAARSGPVGKEYAKHVQRGWDLSEHDAPLLDISREVTCWLHFGGSAYQTLLCDLIPEIRPVRRLAGLAVSCPAGLSLDDLAIDDTALRQAVENRFEDLERILSVGRFQSYLPDQTRRTVVADLFDIPAFYHWMHTRHLWTMKSTDPRWSHVIAGV